MMPIRVVASFLTIFALCFVVRADMVSAQSGHSVLPGQRAEGRQTFQDPKASGRRLDLCLHWARNCGKPAADAWCRTKGHRNAKAWRRQDDVGPTWVLGDKRECSDRGCDGFDFITCQGRVPQPQASGSRKLREVTPRADSSVSAGIIPGSLTDLQERVAKLEQQTGRLTDELAQTRKELGDLREALGGIMRQAQQQPFCKKQRYDDYTCDVSVNPRTGKRESCGAYGCNEVTGLCRNFCHVAPDCAQNYVCDRSSGQAHGSCETDYPQGKRCPP